MRISAAICNFALQYRLILVIADANSEIWNTLCDAEYYVAASAQDLMFVTVKRETTRVNYMPMVMQVIMDFGSILLQAPQLCRAASLSCRLAGRNRVQKLPNNIKMCKYLEAGRNNAKIDLYACKYIFR